MKVTVEFESMEEFEDVMGAKQTRTRAPRGSKKTDDAGAQVPDPAPIPTGGLPGPETAAVIATQMPATTAPTFAVGGFPGTAPAGNVAPGPSEAVMNLVQRINNRLDGALAAAPQSANDSLAWFRTELVKLGANASQATFEQVKQVFLPQLTEAQLEYIAKLMAA